MRTIEPIAISSIFARRVENGDYAYSASIYQNILRYSIVIKQDKPMSDNQSFTWWEITDWLTANKKDNADKQTKERIENPQKTIRNKLKNLVQLNLLRTAGARPITKGIGTTPTYQFTEYGNLLALIIESFAYKTSQEFNRICDEIYNILCTLFPVEEDSTATVIFFSKFFKKCKEKEVFDHIVMLFRDRLTQNTRPIVEMVDLFRLVFIFGFKDDVTRDYIYRLFDETINGLDFKTMKLVLYSLKLDIENKMKESVQYRDAFEKLRFQIRGFADTVALEGHCLICGLYLPIRVEILDYRIRIRNSILGVITEKCPVCNMDNSLQIANVL